MPLSAAKVVSPRVAGRGGDWKMRRDNGMMMMLPRIRVRQRRRMMMMMMMVETPWCYSNKLWLECVCVFCWYSRMVGHSDGLGYINNNICHGLCRRRVSDERGKWRAPLPSSYNHIMNESYLRIVFDVGMIGSVDCPQKSTHGSTYST